MVFNEISQKYEQKPSATNLWGGFSCKNKSSENNGRQTYAHCIAEAEGTTGETLGGIVEVAKTERYPVLVLENVVGLIRKTHLASGEVVDAEIHEVMKKFREVGYAIGWRQVDTRNYAIPQRRTRIWIVAVLQDGDEDAELVVEQILDVLMSLGMQQHLSLNLFLRSDEPPMEVRNTREQEALEYAKAQHKVDIDAGHDLIFDIGKSKSRVDICQDACTCLRPNSKPYSSLRPAFRSPTYIPTAHASGKPKREIITHAPMYIHMNICTYVCMHACMHVCKYVHMYVHSSSPSQ